VTTAYLSLALYMFGVTVLETVAGRWSRRPRRWRGRRPSRWAAARATIGRALVYALWVGLVTGSVRAALAAATAMLVARLVMSAGQRYLDHATGRGLLTVAAPYLAMWAAWAPWQPAAHPVLVSGLATITYGFTGVRPAVEDLVAWTALCTAFLFNVDQATAVVRAILAGVEGQVALAAGLGASAAVEEAAASADAARDGLYRGGALIGNLERFLILLLILQDQWEAIGLVVAAKSIARFEMVRERAEYFLVGTLASVSIALLLGLACRAVFP